MNRLIVIGNGFDRAHNLPTKYSDFLSYLQTYEKEPVRLTDYFILSGTLTPDDQRKYAFCEAIQKYIPHGLLWRDFEDALSYLEYEQLQEDNSCYIMGYGDENWRDSAHHDYQYMIAQELAFAADIPQYMHDWIASINTKVPPVVSSNIIHNDCLFINFNYTDTLEKAYGIPPERILYIHGKAGREERLIVGHHDSSLFQEKPMPVFETEEKWQDYIDSQDDVRILEGKEVIKKYFRETYKDTRAIIAKNSNYFAALLLTEEVYVLGHSLSDIDFDYFLEIRKYVSDSCKWYISYFSQEDYCKAQFFAKELRLQYYQLITFGDIR